MSKFVGLLGGSFNPSTTGHLELGLAAFKELKLDEFWYLVSPQNPFKPRAGMASFSDRVAMAKLNIEGHPQLHVQDIEATYVKAYPEGMIRTADTLHFLLRDFPNHRFAWTMGADNFIKFHEWPGHNYISDNFPILVFPRKGYVKDALKAPSAHLPRLEKPSDARWQNGWYMFPGEGNDVKATAARDIFNTTHIGNDNLEEAARELLESGKTPSFLRPAVAQYALIHHVYDN